MCVRRPQVFLRTSNRVARPPRPATAPGTQLADLYGWSSEKEPQKPQNDDVVCPLPRGAKTPKICALCVLGGWSLHPTEHVATCRNRRAGFMGAMTFRG
jgi:hypothetical protein